MVESSTFVSRREDPSTKNHTSTNVVSCMVAGHELSLDTDPRVFKPTLTTSLLVQSTLQTGVKGRTVLDLGCGSGPIALALALNSAEHVYATDVMPQACDLTRKNAALNNVSNKVTVVQGDLFSAVKHLTFDVIVDDVSGVAEDVARLSSWFPPEVPLGGSDGTSLTIKMLKQSRKYLNAGGHLFFPVISLSQSIKTVSAARAIYGDRLVKVQSKLVPFNQSLNDNFDLLIRLRERGLIQFQQIRSRHFWLLEIYRADIAD